MASGGIDAPVNQPRPLVSSHHRSHMAVVEEITVSAQSAQSYGRGRGNFGPQHSWRGKGNPGRNPAEQTCYVCHSVGHLSYYSPNQPSGGNDKGSNQATSSRAQVNCCTTAQCMPERVESVVANQCLSLIHI